MLQVGGERELTALATEHHPTIVGRVVEVVGDEERRDALGESQASKSNRRVRDATTFVALGDLRSARDREARGRARLRGVDEIGEQPQRARVCVRGVAAHGAY